MLWEHKFKFFFLHHRQRQVNKIECGLEVIAYSLCLTSGGQFWNRVPYACYDFAIPLFLDISLKFCALIDVLHISLNILYRCMGYYKLYFNFCPTDTFYFSFFRGSITNFLKTPFGFHSITTNTFRTISKSINNKCVCRLFALRIKFNGLFCIYDISHL